MTPGTHSASARRAQRTLTPDQQLKFTSLSRKLAVGGEYSLKAQSRVEAREARSAAIVKLVEGKA